MKSFIFTLLFLFLATSICLAGSKGTKALTINCEGGKTAIVNVVQLMSAKYLGVTATLTNGKYYDFPPEKLNTFSIGKTYTFRLPNKYKAKKFEARLWRGKDKSKKTWSSKVINPQGYVMTGPVAESVSCY